MNIDHYTYLLANPEEITSDDLSALDRIIEKYPYFQSARALQLKGLKSQESYRYNDALKITAAHTTDRDILFEYITSDNFIQNEISQHILRQDELIEELDLEEIEIEAEDLSQQVAQENEKEFKSEQQKAAAILNPDLFEKKTESEENAITDDGHKVQATDAIEKPEDVEVKLNEPLAFTEEDTYSFTEWLKLTKAKPIDRSEEVSETTKAHPKKEEIERKFELIDKFIQERPKISPISNASKDSSPKETISLVDGYTQAPDSLMTETLAKVYLQQKNYKKAIQAYNILILKNPEKSGFFADQIRAIKKMINPDKS